MNILIILEESDILRQKIESISSPKIREYWTYLRDFWTKIVALFSHLKIGMFKYDQYVYSIKLPLLILFKILIVISLKSSIKLLFLTPKVIHL